MFVGVAIVLLFMMGCDTVEMFKQCPEYAGCSALSFQGDAVYIGSKGDLVQWNVVTDAVVRLKGYSGLI